MDYNARYYSSVLGRFVSADTIIPDPESSSGFNRYAYVSNNPLKFQDPSGHAECIDVDCKQKVHPITGELIGDGSDDESSGRLDGGESKSEVFFEFGAPSRAPIDQDIADGFGVAATVIDLLAFAISVPKVLAKWGATAAASTTGPQDGLAAYILMEAALEGSPLGIAENVLGGTGLLATATSDYYAGKVYQTSDGLVVGQDTYVSASLALAGLIPNGEIDLVVNFVSFTYNIEGMFPNASPTLHPLLPGNLYIGREPILDSTSTDPDL